MEPQNPKEKRESGKKRESSIHLWGVRFFCMSCSTLFISPNSLKVKRVTVNDYFCVRFTVEAILIFIKMSHMYMCFLYISFF